MDNRGIRKGKRNKTKNLKLPFESADGQYRNFVTIVGHFLCIKGGGGGGGLPCEKEGDAKDYEFWSHCGGQ